MWVAEFTLRDEHDVYTPLCKQHDVEFYLVPHTHYREDDKIHLIVGGTMSGGERAKDAFVTDLRGDDRVTSVERSDDFILVHVTHPESRENEAEITHFYNPRYVLLQPVRNATDGWEYWKLACHNRDKLNEVVQIAVKHYNGRIQRMAEETVSAITSLSMTPELTSKQEQVLSLAEDMGYYTFPRDATVHEVAEETELAYATVQEHLRRAENKIIHHFLRYRL